MRYFAIEPVNLGIRGVFRMHDDLTMEFFSKAKKQWVEDPRLLDYLSGDKSDSREIKREEAVRIVEDLGGNL